MAVNALDRPGNIEDIVSFLLKLPDEIWQEHLQLSPVMAHEVTEQLLSKAHNCDFLARINRNLLGF